MHVHVACMLLLCSSTLYIAPTGNVVFLIVLIILCATCMCKVVIYVCVCVCVFVSDGDGHCKLCVTHLAMLVLHR